MVVERALCSVPSARDQSRDEKDATLLSREPGQHETPMHRSRRMDQHLRSCVATAAGTKEGELPGLSRGGSISAGLEGPMDVFYGKGGRETARGRKHHT